MVVADGVMVNVEMKCRYQKQLMRSGAMDDVRSPRFFRNPDDVFVTGLLKKRLGTCSSFPVLLVALGRRLGYPMSLKVTREHMFCEWNDGVERFNLESNGDGVDSPPDDFYRSDGRETGKLTVLNNVQTLGVFLETAGYCLEACGDVAKAIGIFKLAVRYRPDDANLRRLANRQHLGKRG